MNAICFKCGAPKWEARDACGDCQATPVSEDEVVLSVALSIDAASPQKLEAFAKKIKMGETITVPDELRKTILTVVRMLAPENPTDQRSGSSWIQWLILALAAAVLFVWFHPWPTFQWASHRNTVEAYGYFFKRFPDARLKYGVLDRIRILRDDEVWKAATEAGDIRSFRAYLNSYHDGKHLSEAWSMVGQLADKQWVEVSRSRSEEEIKNFIQDFPETPRKAEAEKRLEELYNDLEWVREQHQLVHYQRFAERFPGHAEIGAIQKTIIDLEVAEIAAGKYGEMPRAEPVSLGGSIAEVDVTNGTEYELTVRYSGPDSKKVVIPPRKTKSLSLLPGEYKIAASVSEAGVTNFYGTDVMKAGYFSSRFYIQSLGFGVRGGSRKTRSVR